MLFYRKNNNANDRANTKQNPASIAILSFSTQYQLIFKIKGIHKISELKFRVTFQTKKTL